MKFIDFNSKNKVKIWEGINAAFFHSEQITFGHVFLEKGAIVGEHNHVHEQWTHVIEGEMEFTVEGETTILKPGMAAFMASNVVHSAKALTAVKVIDCFLPVREDFVELEKNK
jgi:quercetin dioxygenase-like cupin family protein